MILWIVLILLYTPAGVAHGFFTCYGCTCFYTQEWDLVIDCTGTHCRHIPRYNVDPIIIAYINMTGTPCCTPSGECVDSYEGPKILWNRLVFTRIIIIYVSIYTYLYTCIPYRRFWSGCCDSQYYLHETVWRLWVLTVSMIRIFYHFFKFLISIIFNCFYSWSRLSEGYAWDDERCRGCGSLINWPNV